MVPAGGGKLVPFRAGAVVTPGDALISAGDAGWTWFTDPRAVTYNAKTYIGSVQSDGDVVVNTYTHGTQSMSAATVLTAALQVDDHCNPAVLVRDSDKRILVFYTAHSAANLFMHTSINAEDASAFGARVNLDAPVGGTSYTYPCPVQLTGETNAPIYLFFRDIPPASTTEEFSFAKSTDGGSTWSAKTILFNPGANVRSYRKVARNGTTRIDFAVTNNHPADGATSLYHFYYSGGNYYRSDGTQITTALPLTTADLTLVYDGTTERCWVFDLRIDSTGKPVIVFPTFPSTGSHKYRYARWTGSAWSVSTIVEAAGKHIYGTSAEPYYSGGASLDDDPDIVYVSREFLSGWEIWRYETTDNGATFTGAPVTEHADTKNIRPFVPHGRVSTLPVLWLRGRYNTFVDWTLDLRRTNP